VGRPRLQVVRAGSTDTGTPDRQKPWFGTALTGESIVKISRLVVVPAAALAMLGSGATAFAGVGLHWYPGTAPTITKDAANTVTATGQVAGAGKYITAVLRVYYSYPVSCFNPGSDSGPVPGQSQTGSATTPPTTVQANHGNASFSLGENAPSPTAPARACPNSGWHATAGPITITSANVSVTSDNGGSLSYTTTF
jgi:hypothetical protein